MKRIHVWIVLLVLVVLVGATQVTSARFLLQGDIFAKQWGNLIFPRMMTYADVADEVNDSIYIPIIMHRANPVIPPDERELVERFAPVLKFDGSARAFPMSAETYFENMMFPSMIATGAPPRMILGFLIWRLAISPMRAQTP